jgi:hypothetical protein
MLEILAQEQELLLGGIGLGGWGLLLEPVGQPEDLIEAAREKEERADPTGELEGVYSGRFWIHDVNLELRNSGKEVAGSRWEKDE